MSDNRSRGISVRELYDAQFKTLGFTGEWLDLMGDPECTGCIIIYGLPGCGKTTLAMRFAKYLTGFRRVAYNTLEEGRSETIKQSVKRAGFVPPARNFMVLHKEPMDKLRERLNRRKSPDIIFIDSLQYTGLNPITAKKLVDDYPKKLFVFISHAKGKEPKGGTAEAVHYHADIKIYVSGFQAKIQSRYGGDRSKVYTIWQKGADLYGKID